MAYTSQMGEGYPLGKEDRFQTFRGESFRREDLDLSRLEDLKDWKIPEGEPDIRGWNIVDRDGNQIGQVKSLIASPKTRMVYFLVAQVGGVLGLGGKQVLVPLDVIHLDRANQQVHLDATREDLDNAVEWHSDADVDYPAAYRFWEDRQTRMTVEGGEREFAGMRGGEAPARTETTVPLREEELVTRRERHTGEVDIEKHVETEKRTLDVPVTHTEVEVERRAVTGKAGEDLRGGIGESSEVRIPVVEEEIHVEKRPVVKEEIVVRQHPVTETQHVEETVRREVAEVHKEGDIDVETKGDIDVETRRRDLQNRGDIDAE